MNISICTAHKGAIAEMAAANWLLGLGYEVFRNVSGAGPADLVAWDRRTGQMIRIDVKGHSTPYVRADGMYTFPASADRGTDEVHVLFVAGCEVIGFIRRLADATGSEIYWPFDTI